MIPLFITEVSMMKQILGGVLRILLSSSLFVYGSSIFISEVYWDGSDEWIEIKNDGTSIFSGTIYLSGVKSSVLELTIDNLKPGHFRIIADSGSTIDSTDMCTVYKNNGLGLSDTKPRSISLLFSGERIDSFLVSSAQLEQYNNTSTSFHALHTNGEVVSSSGYLAKHIDGGFLAHPCADGTQFPSFGTGETTSDIGIILEDESNVWSGSDIGSGDNSDIVDGSGTNSGTGSDVTVFSGSDFTGKIVEYLDYGQVDTFSGGNILTITEVYPYDTDILSEYIRIEAYKRYQGTITIGGLGHGSSDKSITVDVLPGDVFYITDSAFLSGTAPVYFLPSISLTNGGEQLSLQDKNGKYLQHIRYQGSSNNSAAFFKSGKDDSIDLFTSIGLPSVVHNIFPSPSCDLMHKTSPVRPGEYEVLITGTNGFTCSGLYGINRDLNGGEIIENNGCSIVLSSYTGFTSRVHLVDGSRKVCTSSYTFFLSELSTCPEATDARGSATHLDVYIDEIFPYSGVFPEYIELFFNQGYSGAITIEGLGHGSTQKSISVTASTGDRFVLTSMATGFIAGTKVVEVPGLSLTNGGEMISILGQSGHVIDSVVYSGLVAGESWYKKTYSGFDAGYRKRPTPGFSLDQILHLLPSQDESEKVCGIVFQNKKPFYDVHKINPIATYDGTLLQNSMKSFECSRDFKGSDTSIYTGCNPTYISYPSSGMYSIQLSIRNALDNTTCIVSSMLNLPGKAGIKDASGGDYYEGLYRKWKARFDNAKKGVKELGYTMTSSGDIVGLTTMEAISGSGSIYPSYIVSVLPNPIGKDAGNEVMVLENVGSRDMYLASLTYVINGKRKTFTSGGVIHPGEVSEIQGNLGLRNDSSCISLLSGYTLRDKFCYPKAKEGVTYTGSLLRLERQSENMRKGFQDIQLDHYNNETCMMFEGEKIGCLELPYKVEDALLRKKDAKSLIRLEKKYGTLHTRHQKTKSDISKQKKKFQNDIQKQKSKLVSEIRERKIHQSFVQRLLKRHVSNVGSFTSSSDFQQLYNAYRFMTSGKHLQHISLFRSRGIVLGDDNFASWHAIQQGNLSVKHIETNALHELVVHRVSKSIGNFKEYLYTSHSSLDNKITQ